MSDKEWEDGDDSALYDEGYSAGYKDSIIKLLEILDSVANQERVNDLPSSFTLSVVIATMKELLKEAK
jgi:hypothetical protein